MALTHDPPMPELPWLEPLVIEIVGEYLASQPRPTRHRLGLRRSIDRAVIFGLAHIVADRFHTLPRRRHEAAAVLRAAIAKLPATAGTSRRVAALRRGVALQRLRRL